MPHLVIELTENTRLNCSQEELLDEANAALLASGQFEEPDIKSRCITLDVYRQGTDVADRAFVHATLSVLDGRDQATRRQLGQIVCDAIAEAIRTGDGQSVQVSVNVVEMARAIYAKTVIGA
ncbi:MULTISPECIES: 5-carboxymethyl-2-hydroxymuconate Delta-isomerase [Cupriavidus]|jgi:5-carboxymethyl-2-hydroxymuconate isomerase|uniref:5-carboxymethyl-2-hydroxymuconate Delta-isomerase n=1 Tax=Cupriavidus pauculus TaxID=82633 RepID=A0A5P2HFR7_9BURK|nr:5-carboxymethyl-2-hydroxymuconate Delta-isomerase [Cupriavidus pauculus]QET06353.1 5-carboxymethyl-2-hydroxymuconate Delta-isomerase [Cupriavidus pauculus]